jgi:hypothetical protein
MNKKVSIMDYKQIVVPETNFGADCYSVGNVKEKDDMIREMWNNVSWFKPEIKKLFGKQIKLGFKYHVNKLHVYYEEQVKLCELDYFNRLYKRFPQPPRSAELKLKKINKNKFIPFYDDLKLLQALDDYDSDWCDWRMMDDEKLEKHLITGFNQSIHYELENRISELKVWKALSEDTTK